MSVRIGNTEVGNNSPVFIVAEISGNHNGNLEAAERLVHEAAYAGANAVKFQLINPEELCRVRNKPSMLEQYRAARTPWGWIPGLRLEAAKFGIESFCSVYDKTGVDYLTEIGAHTVKVSGFESGDDELFETISEQLPQATVVASSSDLRSSAIDYADVLLGCINDYPCDVDHLSVFMNNFFPDGFDGLSTHCIETIVPALAVARGAQVIEAHLRLGSCAEESFAFTPEQFQQMVDYVRIAERAL